SRKVEGASTWKVRCLEETEEIQTTAMKTSSENETDESIVGRLVDELKSEKKTLKKEVEKERRKREESV
ncbi:hypothetical protein PENTCL1PPCAC_7319, partial [Pristionchus entomophagus]